MDMTIRELVTDGDILAAYPLMKVLRERIVRDTFLDEVRTQLGAGYRLLAGYETSAPIVLAGIRRSHTLSRGDHLFVDDLVTDESARAAGHGRTMMQFVAREAAAQGISRIYLDARITAKGFYEKLGFTFHTSVPCWIDVERLA
jgi:ribosomal protein S18 acetylase RimI-like enzyme